MTGSMRARGQKTRRYRPTVHGEQKRLFTLVAVMETRRKNN